MHAFTHVMTVEEAQRQRDPLTIAANSDECAAVARRFDWRAVTRLKATLHFSGAGAEVRIDGTVRANVTQACVATARPVTTHVEAPFALRLVPSAQIEAEAEEAELELSGDSLDTVGYQEARFDLADIVAETLALAAPPWPRSLDADVWLVEHGIREDQDSGPFAALAALKDALGKP